jgi:hypothetical protein
VLHRAKLEASGVGHQAASPAGIGPVAAAVGLAAGVGRPSIVELAISAATAAVQRPAVGGHASVRRDAGVLNPVFETGGLGRDRAEDPGDAEAKAGGALPTRGTRSLR